MTLLEKVAYVQGLQEGLKFSSEQPEAKLICALTDILGQAAEQVAALTEQVEELTGEVNEIDLDLSAVELALAGDDTEFTERFRDSFESETEDIEPMEQELEHTALYEIQCPRCSEKILLDEEILGAGGMECPGCGEKLEFDFDKED